MFNNRYGKFIFAGLLFLSFWLGISPVISNADEFSRRQKAEFYFGGGYVNGDLTTGLGISGEIESFPAFSMGAGYNFTDNANLNMDLLIGSTDFVFRYGSSSFSVDTTVSMINVNFDFNILKTRLSPVITGGIGSIHFIGEEGSFSSEETDFSYNIGAGIRWDVGEHFLLKAIYRATWTNMEDTDDAFLLDNFTLAMGYRY